MFVVGITVYMGIDMLESKTRQIPADLLMSYAEVPLGHECLSRV